jgi:cyanophycin synthetase
MATLLEDIPLTDLPTSRDPCSLLERILHLQAAIQRQQKIPVFSPGRVIAKGNAGSSGIVDYAVALPCSVPQATIGTLRWIGQTINRLAPTGSLHPALLQLAQRGFEELLVDLRKFSVKGTNTYHFLQAAFDLGIPSSRLATDVFSFGEGVRCRWLQSTLTDQTAAISVQLARSKIASAHVLRQYGLPTPRHEKVGNLEEALRAAEKLGYPVVVKPDDQEQGRGVAAGLLNAESVGNAFQAARDFSKNILIERFEPGQDYRLTTFRGKVVKILHRRAGGVVGNGQDSILELLKQEQDSPTSRRILRQTGKMRLTLDEEALGLISEQALTPEAIPEPGRFVRLRRKSNISAGGVFSLIPLQDCHPDNHMLAVRAADALRLDPCGVDLIIPDITRSWLETGAAIIEVNASPQLGFSLGPEIYAQMLQEMIEGNGRIPKHLLICFPGVELPEPPALMQIPAIATYEGLSIAQGVWIKGQRKTDSIGSGFLSAQILLRDRSLTSAFCIVSSSEIIEQGLPAEHFDRISCLLPTNSSRQDQQYLNEVRSRVSANTPQIEFLDDITRLKP